MATLKSKAFASIANQTPSLKKTFSSQTLKIEESAYELNVFFSGGVWSYSGDDLLTVFSMSSMDGAD